MLRLDLFETLNRFVFMVWVFGFSVSLEFHGSWTILHHTKHGVYIATLTVFTLAASAPIFNAFWIIFCFSLPSFVMSCVSCNVLASALFGLLALCIPHSPYLFCCRCEQLLGVNGNLRQELMLVKRDHGAGEQFQTLEESLACLLQTLVQKYAAFFFFTSKED